MKKTFANEGFCFFPRLLESGNFFLEVSLFEGGAVVGDDVSLGQLIQNAGGIFQSNDGFGLFLFRDQGFNLFDDSVGFGLFRAPLGIADLADLNALDL